MQFEKKKDLPLTWPSFGIRSSLRIWINHLIYLFPLQLLYSLQFFHINLLAFPSTHQLSVFLSYFPLLFPPQVISLRHLCGLLQHVLQVFLRDYHFSKVLSPPNLNVQPAPITYLLTCFIFLDMLGAHR